MMKRDIGKIDTVISFLHFFFISTCISVTFIRLHKKSAKNVLKGVLFKKKNKLAREREHRGLNDIVSSTVIDIVAIIVIINKIENGNKWKNNSEGNYSVGGFGSC